MNNASKDIGNSESIVGFSGQEGVQLVQVSTQSDIASLEKIWVTSQDADDAAFRPRTGWWSLHSWATSSWLLLKDGTPIGVTAIRNAQEMENAEARLALLPTFRHAPLALLLVDHALYTIQTTTNLRLRIVTSGTATWIKTALQQRGFAVMREAHMMSRPTPATPLPIRDIEGINIRLLREGEEQVLLEALHRAWTNTWNYRPITMEALLSDLEGGRESFFVAVPQIDDAQIVGTAHVLFNRNGTDTETQSSAWISNLTVDPTQRKQGLARKLMTVALNYIHSRGASSVSLGVDGGAIAPVSLYRSMDFEIMRSVVIWEHASTTIQADHG